MDIKNKEALIAEIEQFKEEALKMHIVQVLADTYERSSLFDHNINADGSVIWFKTQARQLWDFWQAAKAQAVQEGFVLVPKEMPKSFDEGLYVYSNSISIVDECSEGFIPMSDINHAEVWKLVIEAQEQNQ